MSVNNTITSKQKTPLIHLFHCGLSAVSGQKAVERQLKLNPIAGNIAVVAIGKAASSMMLGAQNGLKDQIKSALIITKAGHADKTLCWPCIESGHPLPDANSLAAGAQLVEFLAGVPADTHLLALISGGASALVDVLPNDMDLATLQKVNRWLLSSGLGIYEMNRVRQSVSQVKGGKVLNYYSQKHMTQFVISDVENDELEIIGSGLFVTPVKKPTLPDMPDWLKKCIQKPIEIKKVEVESYIVANNDVAREAIIKQAQQIGYTVIDHGQTLYGDVFVVAEKIARQLTESKPALHIWGGETTLTLPEAQGRGGRNQSLALALAILLDKMNNISVLVGATDGSDGPTDDAGAIIDGDTVSRSFASLAQAKAYLDAADAGTFLAEAGDLISTGPTGTNVMDIVIAIKT